VKDEESEIDVKDLAENHPFKSCDRIDKSERDVLDREKESKLKKKLETDD